MSIHWGGRGPGHMSRWPLSAIRDPLWPVLGPLYKDAVFARDSTSLAQRANGDYFAVEADAPRTVYDDNGRNLGIRLEEGWTQGIRNPGASGGGAGVLPTNWNTSFTGGSPTITIVGTVEYKGLTGLRVRFQGTPGSNTSWFVNFESITSNPLTAAQGEQWTSSVFARLVDGTITSAIGNIKCGIIEFTQSGNTFRGVNGATFDKVSLATGALIRNNYTRTLSNASSDRVTGNFYLEVLTGQGAVDVTFDVFCPNIEKSAKVHTPQIVSGAVPEETLTGPVDSLSEGTMVFAGRSPRGSGAGVIAQLDDGSEDNRITLRRTTTGTVYATVYVGGSEVADEYIGDWGADWPNAGMIRWDGTQIFACLGGGVPVTVAAGGPSGLTHWRCGNNSDGNSPWNGLVERFDVKPFAGASPEDLTDPDTPRVLHDDFNRADGDPGSPPGSDTEYVQIPQAGEISNIREAFIASGRLNAPTTAETGTALVATYTGWDFGRPIYRMGARATFGSSPNGAGGGVALISNSEGLDSVDYITGNNGHVGSVHAMFSDVGAYVQYFDGGGDPVTLAFPTYTLSKDGTTIYQFGWRYIGDGFFVWELPNGSEYVVYSLEMVAVMGRYGIYEHYFTSSQTQPSIVEIYGEGA